MHVSHPHTHFCQFPSKIPHLFSPFILENLFCSFFSCQANCDYFIFLTFQDEEEAVSQAESEEKKIIDPNSDEVPEEAAHHIIEYATPFFFSHQKHVLPFF